MDREGGIPRRVNQLAHRLLLNAAVENEERITAEAVHAVAADMGADAAVSERESEEKVLPLRSARVTAAPPASTPPPASVTEPAPPPARDPKLDQRIATLEAQVVEQEAMLRRALTMLVDWVEADGQEKTYRTHAA